MAPCIYIRYPCPHLWCGEPSIQNKSCLADTRSDMINVPSRKCD